MMQKIVDLISCKRKRESSKIRVPMKKPRDCLICDLCKDVIVLSRTLPCGDSFCELCITEHFLKNLVRST